MTTYHVCFRENDKDIILTGKNYTVENEFVALQEWKDEFPNAEFRYLIKVE